MAKIVETRTDRRDIGRRIACTGCPAVFEIEGEGDIHVELMADWPHDDNYEMCSARCPGCGRIAQWTRRPGDWLPRRGPAPK
jgi:hypothetical protein